MSVHGELLGLGVLLRVAFPGSVTTSAVTWVCSSPALGWVSTQELGLGVDKRGREILVPIRTGTESSSTFAIQPCSPPSLLSPVPPTIADDLTDVVVTRLSPAVLTCYASGVPPPTVSWSKEGARLGSRGGGYRVLPRGTARGSTARAGTGVPASPAAASPLAAVFQEPWRSGRRCLHTPAATPARLAAPRARRGSTSGSRCRVKPAPGSCCRGSCALFPG